MYPKYEFNINIYFYKVITHKKSEIWKCGDTVYWKSLEKVVQTVSNKSCQFIPQKTNNKF